jgi:hypothetical protein
MSRWRKRPVEVEARQFLEQDADATADWCGGIVQDLIGVSPKLAIVTLEGTMTADVGDWVIKGVQGEFYPCKPDIFEATYEPADGGGAS